MRLICPSCCNDSRLRPNRLPVGLLAHECHDCHGQWLSWDDYFHWLEKQPEPLDVRTDLELDLPKEEPASARICPECGVILARYHIGHGVPFQLDYCRRCNGVWFDAKEWEAVKSKNLHDKVNRFFTRAWQDRVREEEVARRLDNMFRERLGEIDYARVVEFKSWLQSQESPGPILAFLKEMPGHTTFPKTHSGLRQLRE